MLGGGMDFMNVPATIPDWLTAGAGAGAGGAMTVYLLKIILEWISGRVDKREAAVEASFDRLDKGTDKLIQRMQEQLQSLTTRLERVEAELVHCRDERARDQEELARLRGLVHGMGEAREQAAVIVAAERAGDAIAKKIGGAR